MIQQIKSLCLRIKCHRNKVVKLHTGGHTVYWSLECINAHSLSSGVLAASLGILTILLYVLEKEGNHNG